MFDPNKGKRGDVIKGCWGKGGREWFEGYCFQVEDLEREIQEDIIKRVRDRERERESGD